VVGTEVMGAALVGLTVVGWEVGLVGDLVMGTEVVGAALVGLTVVG
jgi:hypothetical protein